MKIYLMELNNLFNKKILIKKAYLILVLINIIDLMK